MVTYIPEGDIFNIEGVSCFAHGCNCAGAMGKGIAVQFKNRYPVMYKEYKQKCASGAFTLGDAYIYSINNEHVFNLGTQKSWRTKAELSALKKAVGAMLQLAQNSNIDRIAMPKIGAGLGGLNWDDVKRSIEEQSAEFPDIELIVVENYKTV